MESKLSKSNSLHPCQSPILVASSYHKSNISALQERPILSIWRHEPLNSFTVSRELALSLAAIHCYQIGMSLYDNSKIEYTISADCPWYEAQHLFGPPNVNWCEPTVCKIINEPANTYSNLALLTCCVPDL